jgi:hypothetical protein
MNNNNKKKKKKKRERGPKPGQRMETPWGKKV